MTVFLATIDTLYYTIIGISTRFLSRLLRAYVYPDVSKAEIVPNDHIEEEKRETTFKSVNDILATRAMDVPQKHSIMYIGVPETQLYQNPTIEFDGARETIPYGSLVLAQEPKGRFQKIVFKESEGWVLKENLVDRAAGVYPEFHIGESYPAEHQVTIQTRTVIGDPFHLTGEGHPLHAGEYVLYKLWRKGQCIEWPPIRPRVLGTWHRILKGNSKIHVGVTPRAGAIMEYTGDGDVGHVAFVESVFPENTIAISEIDFSNAGVYHEREYTKEEWRELRPVFIDVT